ncbi:hypothetical protein SAMN02745121_05080 [Nannocystis exedens]|uniref:Uncharacterized protein n=1 Tax=Nannocystis exedens TaxID=54 RepID=A0A1I2CDH8_9BACT|nr:hypothetical protein [Nannocystis exedens]PCC68353.1 hypothetical protein NAEX_01363 [Nannocystis exedens]SFE66407.1 hypothetical protein SAMN02745121_05080 [Nannocystis exedens]
MFWTEPNGNAYYILAHPYMAAVLNGLANADTLMVDDLLDHDVKSFFETYGPSNRQPFVSKLVLVDWRRPLRSSTAASWARRTASSDVSG